MNESEKNVVISNPVIRSSVTENQVESSSKIFYNGPSMLNPDEDVIGVLQKAPSRSRKTHGMAQVWVFPAALMAMTEEYVKRGPANGNGSVIKEMIDNGVDRACCHDCGFRGKAAGGSGKCYCHGRTLFLGANQMLKGLANKNWPTLMPNELRQEMWIMYKTGIEIRLTAYGEGLCLPDWCLDTLTTVPGRAYTHAWDGLDARRAAKWQRVFMASVETREQQLRARAAGWRCFKVIPAKSEEFYPREEFRCPASKEMGKVSSCGRCKGCDGWRNSFSKDVVIMDHSMLNNLAEYKEKIKAEKEEMIRSSRSMERAIW